MHICLSWQISTIPENALRNDTELSVWRSPHEIFYLFHAISFRRRAVQLKAPTMIDRTEKSERHLELSNFKLTGN